MSIPGTILGEGLDSTKYPTVITKEYEMTEGMHTFNCSSSYTYFVVPKCATKQVDLFLRNRFNITLSISLSPLPNTHIIGIFCYKKGNKFMIKRSY